MSESKVSDLIAKAKETKGEDSEEQEVQAKVEVSTPDLSVQSTSETKEEVFECYYSSIPATNLVTDYGHKVVFAKGRFVTRDPNIIAYLDNEIKCGIPFITKGEPLTTSELDPMSALKKEHFKEFMEMARNGEIKDFGEYGNGTKGGTVLTSEDVAN